MFKAFLILGLIGLLGCSDKVAGRGGVDETSNGIHAYITDEQGQGVGAALVVLRPADYLPHANMALHNPAQGIYNGITNEYGHFSIDTLPPGEYLLEVRALQQGTLTKITVTPGAALNEVLADTLTLAQYAAVVGKVELPPDVPYARVVLLGLDRVVLTDAEGNYRIEDLPAGDFLAVAFSPQAVSLGELELHLEPAEELTAGEFVSQTPELSEWQHQMDISISTAALTETLHDYSFPIHLRGSDFPTEATWSGADLRMTDGRDSAVDWALTYWNPTAREATIWVYLAEFPAQDSLQLRLRWGRVGTLPQSSPSAVFGLERWAAVAPLQQVYAEANGELRTPVYGTDIGSGLVLSTQGFPPEFSGAGAWFDGVDQGVGIPGVMWDLGRQEFTISAWLRPEAEGGIWLSRDFKASENWNHSERALYLGGDFSVTENRGLQPVQVTHASPYNSYARAVDSITLHEWVHLALRSSKWSGDTMQVQWFINGAPVETLGDLVVAEPDKMRDSIYVATQMFGRSFQGSIYQLQIAKQALPVAQIAFDALIQRPDAAMVRFKRLFKLQDISAININNEPLY